MYMCIYINMYICIYLYLYQYNIYVCIFILFGGEMDSEWYDAVVEVRTEITYMYIYIISIYVYTFCSAAKWTPSGTTRSSRCERRFYTCICVYIYIAISIE